MKRLLRVHSQVILAFRHCLRDAVVVLSLLVLDILVLVANAAEVLGAVLLELVSRHRVEIGICLRILLEAVLIHIVYNVWFNVYIGNA